MKKVYNIIIYVILGALLIANFIPERSPQPSVADKAFYVKVGETVKNYSSLYAFATAYGVDIEPLADPVGEKKLYTIEYTILYYSPREVIVNVLGTEIETNAVITRYTMTAFRANQPMWYATAVFATIIFMTGYVIWYKTKQIKKVL